MIQIFDSTALTASLGLEMCILLHLEELIQPFHEEIIQRLKSSIPRLFLLHIDKVLDDPNLQTFQITLNKGMCVLFSKAAKSSKNIADFKDTLC